MNVDSAATDAFLPVLLESREKFVAYVRRRVPTPEQAEDIVQEGMIKALRNAPHLEDGDRLLPWFYRVLQNAITDSYRRAATERKYVLNTEPEDRAMELEDERELCACFLEILPSMKSEYAEVIRIGDLEELPTEVLVSRLGISANNLKVRRHRARQVLRQRLEETCGACAEHACLDCTCSS